MQDVEVEVLVDKMFAGDKTDEIAFRGKRRYLNKLERLSIDNIAKQAMKTVPAEGSAYTCTIEEYGVFDNVVLRESTRRTPKADQVEIQIKASTLNFRDIMIAMGLLSNDTVNGGLFSKTFCLECAIV